MATRDQGLTLFTGICFLVGTLVVIQLWLLAAALEAALADEPGVLLPATFASLVLFLVNLGLLGQVIAFDRRVQRATRDE
ncbi:MAG TPA: DUF6755 family protein [Anaeromyxobacteraceae bacterium]|nr:DUF6755 family protein [Anaeromyxobacteraceae bacterium]